jgi:hypothetical protein
LRVEFHSGESFAAILIQQDAIADESAVVFVQQPCFPEKRQCRESFTAISIPRHTNADKCTRSFHVRRDSRIAASIAGSDSHKAPAMIIESLIGLSLVLNVSFDNPAPMHSDRIAWLQRSIPHPVKPMAR